MRDRRGRGGEIEGVAFSWIVHHKVAGKGYKGYITVPVCKQDF
jgi:hypothetical protein